jgi:hypothetical protein
MQRTVEILLVIGVLVNLVKGADLLLRPHQQKWLQEKVETTTLWLTYLKPLRFYKTLSKRNSQIVIAVIASAYYGFLILQLAVIHEAVVTSSIKFFVFPSPGNKLFGDLFLKVVVLGFGIGTIQFAFPAIRWLLEGTRFQYFLLKFSLFVFLLLITFGIAIALNAIDSPILKQLILNALILCTLFLLVSLLLVLSAGVTVIIYSILLLLLEGLLILLRGIAWRIAEYNKGAFAAIIVIITITLGITEVYLRFQPPPSTPVISTPSPTPQL